MESKVEKQNGHYFLNGGGEMGELTRAYNWGASPIGKPEDWSQSLRTTVGIILHSAFPMFLFWGKDLTCFYNDAYRPSLGSNGKHPMVGKAGKDVWPEIWDFIGPLIDKVLATGEAVWFEDQLLPIYRNGKMEDVYWTFSYSPVYGDNGSINGVLVTCTETTDKVNTVKRLLESEQNFEVLIKEATVGIVVLSGDDMVVAIVNDAYGKLIDRTPAELLNKKLFDVIPEVKAEFLPLLKNVKDTGAPLYLYDHPYALVNGKKGFLNVVYQPYKNENGKNIGVMALCHEVTEQVIARKKVEESEQRIRDIIEAAPFPIGIYTGKEMRISFANRSILDVWGKGYDVIGKLYTEILPELNNQAIFKQLDDVYITGIPFHARNQRVDLVIDGILQPYYFNYSFTPLYDNAGNVYGVMNTAAEVTDLNIAKQKVEESEKNLRNMILQAPVAMCIMLGPEFIVEVANDFMIELWGKPAEAVMNKPIFEGLPDAKDQGLEKLLHDVYVTGETFKANEHPVILLRNGKQDTVYQNFVYEPYRNPDGKILGVLAITIDVSAQVLARQQIESLVDERTKELAIVNQSLQRSNAELEQFAYIASHDLQEPLRKVITFSQMLEQNLGKVDERSQNYLSKINASTARMSNLIKDVLTYSQLTLKQVFTPVDLQKVIDDIRTDYELLIEQKKAEIIYIDLPVIEAIPLQMSQLFSNLISNALKFARTDITPVITIKATQLNKETYTPVLSSDNEIYYKIEVSDNGVGFEQEYAEQIFNIFQRLHGKAEYSGTGIGLAMCKKIVQNHDGEINATSVKDKGAVFTIILPAKH